jgi:ABC-type uncharacterized transport system involved in gliding motility auxiliary subunit
LGKLDEPIHLSLYFSDKTTADSGRGDISALRTYFDRVRETLEEMAELSDGKLKLEIIDPIAFSEAEDAANAAGLQGLPVAASGEKVYLGLVGSNSTEGQGVIAFFDPGKETVLEYDLAKLISDLNLTKKPPVGILSTLPVGGGVDPRTQQPGEPWAVYQRLQEQFDVKPLNAAGLKQIPADLQLLVLIHPKNFDDDALNAIDQFVLRGGHLLAFVDPQADLDTVGNDPNNPLAAVLANKSSDLALLFKAWGVEYSPEQVVLDRAHAVLMSGKQGAAIRNPALLRLGRSELSADDVITANLDTIHVANSGFFRLAKDSALKLTPLLQSGDQSMTVGVEKVKFLDDPSSLLTGFVPTGERFVIAARLDGKFKTAFPARQDPGHLAESKDTGSVILFADTDLLTDRLWVREQNFFGHKVLNPFAGNGDLFLNTVDNLNGSTDLLAIRGRGTSHRPFDRVESLKVAADDRFRSKEQELQNELTETEQKLAALQTGKSKDQAMVLSPDQQKELENFLKRKLEIRKQLRDVRRQLDADIENLGLRLKFINIALIPILLTVLAMAFAGWKARQRTA